MKLSQNLNVRKIIEDLASKKLVKEARKRLKLRDKAAKSSGNPSNSEIWTEVFLQASSREEFPYLSALVDQQLPVAPLIADLTRFSSKEIHTGEEDEVLIDTQSLTKEQVSISLIIFPGNVSWKII